MHVQDGIKAVSFLQSLVRTFPLDRTGSVELTIVISPYVGLYTYQLSQTPPSQWTTIDRTISTLTWLIYWGSSAWYFRNGDKGTGVFTGIAGALQAAVLTL